MFPLNALKIHLAGSHEAVLLGMDWTVAERKQFWSQWMYLNFFKLSFLGTLFFKLSFPPGIC